MMISRLELATSSKRVQYFRITASEIIFNEISFWIFWNMLLCMKTISQNSNELSLRPFKKLLVTFKQTFNIVGKQVDGSGGNIITPDSWEPLNEQRVLWVILRAWRIAPGELVLEVARKPSGTNPLS